MIEPVFFDVETYADQAYRVAKLSELQYILDPRFELLSVAAAADGRLRVWRGDSNEWLKQFQEWDSEGRRFVAHHARFDLRVLSLRCGFRPLVVGDTCSVARYFWFAKHGLDALGHELFDVGKQGRPLLGRRLRDISSSEWDTLARYNAGDVVLCRRLWLKFAHLLPPGELDLIQQTLAIQMRPRHIDEDAAHELVARCETEVAELEAKRPRIPLLASRPHELKSYLRTTFGVEVHTLDKKKIGDVERFGPEAAQFIRGVWRFKELEKARNDVQNLNARMGLGDGTVLIDLNYCGAHSHRWTSGSGDAASSSFNYQNLSKSAGIRELNVPRPGNVFIIGDLAQIEARITAWLADEQVQLTVYRSGRDPYLEFATPLFGRPLSKADKLERGVGKAAVLGLGFGMGAKLFAEGLKLNAPRGLELLQRKFEVSDPVEAARRVVQEYRTSYPRIHANTTAMYETFKYAVNGPPCGAIPVRRWIRFRREGGDVVVDLPTGGFLTYRSVALVERTGQFGIELAPTYLNRRVSFSMPIENAVQSIARDIFGSALLTLERAGFEIAFHVHDEVVVEVEAGQAAERLAQFEQIFGADDPRCPGLPIACDAFLTDKYTKDEKYMRQFTKDIVARTCKVRDVRPRSCEVTS